MRAGYKGQTILNSASIYAPYIPQKETWQRYLRRLGSGLNGVSERSETVTEEDIIARAQKYMQIKYPGPYQVEQFFNAAKLIWDLRLQFDDPKEETIWMLRWA